MILSISVVIHCVLYSCTLIILDIKVWMLTGDKLGTAENIGKSCNLLTENMDKKRLKSKERKDI